VSHWPAVAKGRESPAAFEDYVSSFDNSAEVDALRMPPSANGRIFYAEDAETAGHIPKAKRGVLGEISPELAQQVREFLMSQLRR